MLIALVGGIFALLVSGTLFSLPVAIGFVALSGEIGTGPLLR
jgi:Cu/Ag efflux pump CusA